MFDVLEILSDCFMLCIVKVWYCVLILQWYKTFILHVGQLTLTNQNGFSLVAKQFEFIEFTNHPISPIECEY